MYTRFFQSVVDMNRYDSRRSFQHQCIHCQESGRGLYKVSSQLGQFYDFSLSYRLEINRNCPNAMLLIITNPVNSTVAIATEVFKKAGCYDPNRYNSDNILKMWCTYHCTYRCHELCIYILSLSSPLLLQNLWCNHAGCCSSQHICCRS